jgi:hypothetical protein
MDIVVIFQRLEKFSGASAFFIAQVREVFRAITQLAGDDCPSVSRQPLRNGVQVVPLSNETGTRRAFRDIIVFHVRKRLDILRARFDRRRFDIRGRIRMMRFDQANVIEEKLVTARRTKLAAFLEEHPNFRSCAVVIVSQDLDDYRHLVRRVTFENDMFHNEFVVADARPFFDRALDDVARDAGFACLVDDGREAGIRARLSPAKLRGHHNLFHEFSDELTFFQPGDFSFGMKPLATHTADVSGAQQLSKPARGFGEGLALPGS